MRAHLVLARYPSFVTDSVSVDTVSHNKDKVLCHFSHFLTRSVTFSLCFRRLRSRMCIFRQAPTSGTQRSYSVPPSSASKRILSIIIQETYHLGGFGARFRRILRDDTIPELLLCRYSEILEDFDTWICRSCVSTHMIFVVGDIYVIGRHDGRIERLDVSNVHPHKFLNHPCFMPVSSFVRTSSLHSPATGSPVHPLPLSPFSLQAITFLVLCMVTVKLLMRGSLFSTCRIGISIPSTPRILEYVSPSMYASKSCSWPRSDRPTSNTSPTKHCSENKTSVSHRVRARRKIGLCSMHIEESMWFGTAPRGASECCQR
jgi:hypothetical protein